MESKKIILFDGICNLCNSFVEFVIRIDPMAIFQFASLQSTFGQKVLRKYGLPPQTFDSVLLWENGRLYQKSIAVFRIFRKLKFPFNLLSGFLLLPGFLIDPLYTIISKRRYQLRGKTDHCMTPSSILQKRFL
ncbi:MAG: thiol-disulfide oxidoreductase DCC family protein [Flavobacteriales bacterium AspAUS03]